MIIGLIFFLGVCRCEVVHSLLIRNVASACFVTVFAAEPNKNPKEAAMKMGPTMRIPMAKKRYNFCDLFFFDISDIVCVNHIVTVIFISIE